MGAYCVPDPVSNRSCVCPFVGPCSANVTDVRLVNGNSLRAGRVEVLRGGTWGTVCDTVWTLSDAQVVCRLLGFGEVEVARGKAFYGSGTGLIQSHGIQCSGTETDWNDCRFTNTGCNHSDDVGVICSKMFHIKTFSVPKFTSLLRGKCTIYAYSLMSK